MCYLYETCARGNISFCRYMGLKNLHILICNNGFISRNLMFVQGALFEMTFIACFLHTLMLSISIKQKLELNIFMFLNMKPNIKPK